MAFLLVVFTFQGCRNDDEPSANIPREAVYDFVTFAESSENGSVLTLQKNADSPLISYISDIDFSRVKSIQLGERLIICYNRVDGDTYTSGNITVYGYLKLANSDQNLLYGSASEFNGWKCPPMKVNSLWRTGCYINLDANISVLHAASPESFVVVADESTVHYQYPELYIYYQNENDNDGDNPYRVYASFDVSDLWEHSSCKGVIVNYPSSDGFNSVLFNK